MPTNDYCNGDVQAPHEAHVFGHVGSNSVCLRCDVLEHTVLVPEPQKPVEEIAEGICQATVHDGCFPCNCKAIADALRAEREETD